MTEPSFNPLDHELESLVANGSPMPATAAVPALLIRRATDVHEPLVGKRARFLMTSCSSEGEWLAFGWRDGLRIVSSAAQAVPGIDEPALWIQEERDYYDPETLGRVAVGVSRLWVEQYISSTGSAQTRLPESWLDNLNRNPNAAEVRALHPSEGHPDPVGRRVVSVGETLETDLRAVGPVRMTDAGELAIPVIAERDWYRWSSRNYSSEPHPTLRWESAGDVWGE